MIVILCEKPSVAKDVSSSFSIKKVFDGYYFCKDQNKEYAVTWAYGHLFEIDNNIAPEKWEWESLPVFPEKFKYTLISDKKIKKQFSIIKNLLSKADAVIINTDAGEEGELIARLILHHAGWKNWKETYRLWTSEALTPEVVKRELKNGLKPVTEFDSLFWSALSRQHSDWLVGINLTRAATLQSPDGEKNRAKVWSIGRVQTPTLALIVERTLEVENFKSEPYWVIKATFKKDSFEFKAYLLTNSVKNTTIRPEEKKTRKHEEENEEENEEKKEDFGKFRLSKKDAEIILKKLENEKKGRVQDVKTKIISEPPPLLHSLTSLQREANKLYGFTAEKTLNLVQKLYEERKCVSYPRTDAQHLAESTKPLVKEILKKLGREDLVPAVDRVGKRVFDDTKLTDHHAIIPLAPLPEEVSADEKKIYELILRKFFGVFMPEYRYETTEVLINMKGYIFYAKGKRDLSPGWKSLYREEKSECNLPALKKGEEVIKKKLEVEQKTTQPPPLYTEGMLLKKMEKLNLGTPATRHSIIETLKVRNYIIVKGKALVATEKGKELITKLKKMNSQLVKPELTGEWEKRRNEIYKKKLGKNGYLEFIEEVKKLVLEEIAKIKKNSFVSCTSTSKNDKYQKRTFFIKTSRKKFSKNKKQKNHKNTHNKNKIF